MPQLNSPLLKDAQVRSPAILNRLIAKIKNSYDIMRTNNFDSAIIPYSSLDKRETYVPLVLRYNGVIGPGAPTSFNVDLCNIPAIEGSDEGMDLVSLWATSQGIGGAVVDVTIDIFRYVAGDVLVQTLTMLFADPTPKKASSAVAPAVTFSNNDLIRMVVNCPVGATINTPTVVCLFRVNHAS